MQSIANDKIILRKISWKKCFLHFSQTRIFFHNDLFSPIKPGKKAASLINLNGCGDELLKFKPICNDFPQDFPMIQPWKLSSLLNGYLRGIGWILKVFDEISFFGNTTSLKVETPSPKRKRKKLKQSIKY